MKSHLIAIARIGCVAIGALATVLPSSSARADSWIFRPSKYSHDPYSGQRVHQYAAKNVPYVQEDPTYRQSGYRHIRTSIRGIGGTDHSHVVKTWGAGESIRPYGEWLYPYRAGATPFGPWGNPQGPWTLPFDSWVNPYGLGQLPYYGWPHGGYGRSYPTPLPSGPGHPGYGPVHGPGRGPSRGPGGHGAGPSGGATHLPHGGGPSASHGHTGGGSHGHVGAGP